MLPWQNSARANRFASITHAHHTYPAEQTHNMQPIYQMLQNQNRNIAHLNREISCLEDKLKDLRKNSRNYQRETDKILLNQSDHIASVNTNISNLETNILEVQTATQTNSASYDNLTEHIAVSDNNFSIDNVNTISKEYINCVNKLNFTINLINEKKGNIQGAGDYAYVLRPIFEKKYTDNAVSINGYIVVASAEPVKMIHFFEPDSNWDNKQNNIWNAYREKCETDGYNRFNELRGKSPKKTQFYVLIPYDWETGVKIAFYLYIPDILGKTGEEWIKIVSGFNLTPSITKYTKISDLPASYISYLGKIEDAFNTFSSDIIDYKLGTIYQLGPDNKFNTLKIVSSQEYPSWDGQFIANSYIPGSNINMPNIIFQINTELNRSYTGMQEGQIVIVEYVVGANYYTGVVKMLRIDGYDGLCYQIQSININEIFETSVKMIGDVDIQGNLNVKRYNGDTVISTDNTRGVTTFQGKVGINQQSHEVKGLLDIDNLTQQGVLDLFDKFVPELTNSYDIIQVIINPYTKLSQFPVGKTDNIIYSKGSHNLDLYIPNHKTKSSEVVLYVHGGSFVSGNEEDKDALRAMARFNSEGYITGSMAYSLQHPPTGGSTLDWWINAVVKATNDLIDAIEYIKSLGATGVHIIGYSAGAIMVLMTALNDKHPFTSILKPIPSNFILTRTSIGGSLITPDGYSIVEHLDETCPRLLLWNGTADKTVDQKGALAIKQRYTELGKSEECQLYLLDGSTHSSILTDTYTGKNVLDVSIASIGSYLFTSITEMFAQGNSLFDYRNQCTVFSVPIKAIIKPENIKILHTDGIEVVMGNQTSVGLGKSLITSDYSFRRLQQLVKEVNQMAPEFEAANDPSYMFSFIELIQNENKNWYLVSMRAYNSGTIANEMIFAMTYIDVNYIMNDKSTAKALLAIMDYTSRELRFLNYVCLLFKDSLLIDNAGNYTVDNDNSIKLQSSIKNNPYFSNRWDLLPESYIFSLNRSKNDVYMLMEGALQWNNKKPSDCWNGDNNVQLVVDIILGQNKSFYNYRKNSCFPIHYRWREGRKISFTNTIDVGNNVYVIGSGFDLNSLLGQSLVVKGDNTIAGNFYVSDANNVNIFKVDNVAKTITNSYKVGIGMDEPRSILDIKDTTVQDILNEVDAAAEQWKDMNILVGQLRQASSEEVFGEIITNNSSLPPTTQQYYAIARLNLETMLSTDTILIYHWLMRQWENQLLGEIEDPPNQFPLRNIKLLYQQILDNETIYDGRIIGSCVNDIFGWKLSRRICFRNINNGHMYFLTNGTNVQNYGIRYNSNSNLPRFYEQRILTGNTLSEAVRRIRKVTDVINKVEGLNTLITMTNKYSEIKTRRLYEIVINLGDIFDVTVRDIYMDLDTPDNIEFVNSTNSKDFGSNERVKFANFYIKLMNKYGIKNKDNINNTNTIKPNDYFILYYDDLDVDYIGVINCIKVAGSNITLVVSEFSIQEYIQPSLNVTGDAKVIGDLMVTNQTTKDNYVSIAPGQQFFGVNTDERFINYQDIDCTTCDNIYTSKHNVYIKHKSYPVMVCERIREDEEKEDMNLAAFGTYSAFTAKRKSELYDFHKIDEYAQKLQTKHETNNPTDTVTHMRYGPDISFEVCDKTNRSVELGQIQLTIDGMDPTTGYLQCGFGIQVNDFKKGASFENVRRNLMYVDNSSRLFVKEVSLNGRILSTDGSGNLLCDGGNIYVSSANYPYQRVFPTIQQLQLNLNNKFINGYRKNVHSMIEFFNTNLTNVKYMDLLDDYSLSNKEYQKTLVSMVNHYDISNNPVRVQMVTVSGNIFADSKYDADDGDVSTQSTNIYNNPEISQAILVGIGGMARCTTNTKLLNVCIGTENKWGTIVLTRLIMEVPVE